MAGNARVKVLVTGSTGYVGKIIALGLGHRWEIIGVSRSTDTDKNNFKCNLEDVDQVRRLSYKVSPDFIIHAAGDKNIARCKADPVAAYQANVQTTINLVYHFRDIPIFYISSDYAFLGDRGGYREDDAIGAITDYGRTKGCAELAGLTLSPNFYVLRLSALYDRDATFFRFLKESLTLGEHVTCFEDAFFSPTYVGVFLNILQRLVENSKGDRRVYHACGQRISRYYFAMLYAREAGLDFSLIRSGRRTSETAPFIFADISLDNTLTGECLNLSVAHHQEYLGLLGLTP